LVQDKFLGVDFSTIVEPGEAGLDPLRAVHSSGSGDLFLKHVLKQLDIDAQDSILDVGCGKGSAMRVMLRFPFHRIDGIELSDQLASVARDNFRRLRVPADRWKIITADAAAFKDLDHYNYIYLFHPFFAEVMVQFMDNLALSLCRRPRRLRIIYCNPVYHEHIVSAGTFSKVCEYPGRKKIWLYSN
jgi:tRNA1(Val) A37 N6-methylase TrmN6